MTTGQWFWRRISVMNRALEQVRQHAEMMGPDQLNRWALLLKVGKPGVVAELTREEQRTVKALRKRIKPEIKQCYANSQRAFFRSALNNVNDVQYCEGYYIRHDHPVIQNHAWLTINGKVVDLTQPSAEFDYFGVEIPWELVQTYMLERETHGPLLDDWETGYKYTAMILDPDGLGRIVDAFSRVSV